MGASSKCSRWTTLSRQTRTMSKQISLASLAIVLLAGCHSVTGFGSGAPESVCKTMLPGHGADIQTSPSPYKVILSKTSVSGYDTIDITLTSKNGQDQFKGFIIQVRKASGSDDKAIGQFIDSNLSDDVQILKCNDVPKTGVTHAGPNLKSSVKAQWIAPNDADAEYVVYYTVVGPDAETYWVKTQHEEKVRVTKSLTAVNPAQEPVKAAASQALKDMWSKFYDGCGKTKGCFGMPGKCIEQYLADPSSDNPVVCDMMVTWSKIGDKGRFQLTGKPGGSTKGYVGLGLSEDASMGKDSVVGCILSSSKAGAVEILRYHNDGKSNSGFEKPTEGLNGQSANSIDGQIFCEFEQTNHKINDLTIDFEKDYYLLLSRSTSATKEYLGKHSGIEDRGPSPQAINIADTDILGASANGWLIQLHGGLNVIAWLLCASTGMFTARYFKLTHTEFTPCGKAFWFALHITCMALTVFLTICASVFIFINRGIEPFKEPGLHVIFGAIVVGLAIVQVIIAFLRPHPGTPSRPYFNWFHWLVGNSAHIVGIVCILLAAEVDLADLKRFGDKYLWSWIILGIVLFHVLMHIVMSIHTLWADKQMDASNKKRAVTPGPMKTNGLTVEAPGTAFRTFMLSLYLLVMAAGAIALVALVFWPKAAKEEPVE